MRISGRTYAVALLGLAATALIHTLVQLEVFGEWGTLALSDFGSVAVVTAAAGVVMWSALGFAPGTPERRTWLLVAAGVGAFALGDLVWSYIEVVQRQEVPYPGLPDVFYTLQVLILGPALFLGGMAYRDRVDVRGPLLLTIVATLSLVAMVFVGFLWPYIIADPEVELFEAVFNVFYVVTDIVLLLGAAIFTGLVTTSARLGTQAHAWWFVVAGAAVLTLTDTAFAWITAAGTYEAGALVDYGWLLAHVLMAIGASLARDGVDAAAAKRAVPAARP